MLTIEKLEAAQRPDAVREACTFGDVQAGDFVSNEPGGRARWAELLSVLDEPGGETVAVTFRVGGGQCWVISKHRDETTTRDASVVL